MGGGDGFRSKAPAPSGRPRGGHGPAGGADPADPLGSGGGRILGDPFDGLGDVAGELPGLELADVRPPEPARAPSLAPAAPRPGGPATGMVSTSGAALLDGRSDPRDALEVAQLADYGPAPASLFGAVPYCVLVLTRRSALKKALADLLRLRTRAQADALEALIELGRALHAYKGTPEVAALGPLVAAADRLGEVAGQRTEEWDKARRVADAQRASLTTKIEEVERKTGPYRDRETKLATQMNVRETDLRREKARLTRVEIELRNVSSAPDADAARVELLTAEREARRADVATAQGKVDEVAPQLAEARRELAVMQQALNDLEGQRRAVDKAQARTDKGHLSTATAAETQYHEAVAALASEALARGIADTVAPEEAKAAHRMVAAQRAREREVSLHEAALLAYDRPAFQKGAAVLGGAGLVILTMLLVVILR